jgi:hypothetical protein
MRTSIASGVLLLWSVLTLQAATAQNIKVSVKGDRLAFASVADYKRAVDEPSDRTKAGFARTVAALKGFTSLAEKQKSASPRAAGPDSAMIRDEYFAAILNADHVVQIGDYIFRIDPAVERVYVLPVEHEKEYSDLIAGNSRNTNLKVLSTNDDVLEKLQVAAQGTRGLFCSQSGIGSRHHNVPFGAFTAYADFNKYGIYYSLNAAVDPYGSSGFPYVFDFTGGITANKGYVYYHVRCGSTASYAIATGGSWKLTYQKYQSYQGSTNLNQVYFVFRIKSSAGVFQTPNVGFRVNK